MLNLLMESQYSEIYLISRISVYDSQNEPRPDSSLSSSDPEATPCSVKQNILKTRNIAY